MSVHQFPSPAPVQESTAALTLRDAGFDAFVSDSESSVKGGVCVRMNRFDSRIQWSGLADEVAPLDYAFTEQSGRFILHAGRVGADGAMGQLSAFVASLLAAADARRQLQAA
jgi:hypothetical protein